MTGHKFSRSSLTSAAISSLLAVFILTTAGAFQDAHAASKKKHHHKRRAPSGAHKTSAPEPEENNPEPSEPTGGAGAATESSEPSSAPAAEPAAGGSEEAAPPPKRKKIKMEGEASAEESPGAPSGLPWLELSLGVAGFNRNLSFHQDPRNQMNPYSLPFWPVGVLSGVFYLEPLVNPLGNLGVEGDMMQAFGVTSKFSNSSTSYSSTVHDYSGGLRYRFPFGDANMIFISGRYGEDAFVFHGDNRSSLQTPDTIYRYVRGGVGLRWALASSVSLDLGAGYRYVTNQAGPEITGKYFPNLTVAGADAEAALTYGFNDLYAVRAGIDWRRYWFDFHSKAGDNYIVGGAIDQSFLFSVSLVVSIGGASHAEAEAEPAPAKAKPRKAKTDEGEGESGGSDEGGGDSAGAKSGGGDEP